jgi:hypothetical protein
MDQLLTERLTFNQSSLQDYTECPRRFELGTLMDTSWPAPNTTPLEKVEKLTEVGNDFHQLCQQFFIGIDPQLISASINNQDLRDLWDSFLPYGRTLFSFPRFTEQILRVPIGNHYLIAKFDLIVQLAEDDYLIIDWKTTSKKPPRSVLSTRMQTYLYPFIFQQAGAELFPGPPLSPSSIKLQYWFPLASIKEEVFPYTQAKHSEVTETITALIEQIQDKILAGASFALTDNLKQCKFCLYRSFCDRGHQSSSLSEGLDLENENLSTNHFDFDLINEIEF